MQEIEGAKDKAVSDFVYSLPLEEKYSELFFVNVEGSRTFKSVENVPEAFYADSKADSKKPLVSGGILLFSYNISKDPLETYEFIKSIYDFYNEHNLVPPFIAVDQEGGEVNRLRSLTKSLSSQKKIAESLSGDEARAVYSSQARQMKELGFHLNLAPVVEIENEANSSFLGSRTFGSADKVLLYGKTAVLSYEENGIAAALKHFPGNSSTDPHTGLPEIKTSKETLENEYLLPFKELLPYSSAVLMSHARIKITDDDSYTDEKIPSCLSRYWVSNVVKEQLGFTGLVISDDIFMGALADNGFPPEEACIKAVEAGIDSIMISEKRFGSSAALLYKKALEDKAFASKIDEAVKSVIKFKINAGILVLEEKSEEEEYSVPEYTVRVNKSYPEFNLSAFDKEY